MRKVLLIRCWTDVNPRTEFAICLEEPSELGITESIRRDAPNIKDDEDPPDGYILWDTSTNHLEFIAVELQPRQLVIVR